MTFKSEADLQLHTITLKHFKYVRDNYDTLDCDITLDEVKEAIGYMEKVVELNKLELELNK